MKKQEILRSDWVDFLDGFSKQHQGWLVNVEVTADGKKRQLEARELPLSGITADVKHNGEYTVSVILEKGEKQYLTHIVEKARRIELEKTEEGADQGVTIESADGSKAYLRFRTSAMPETLDGVSSAEMGWKSSRATK